MAIGTVILCAKVLLRSNDDPLRHDAYQHDEMVINGKVAKLSFIQCELYTLFAALCRLLETITGSFSFRSMQAIKIVVVNM